MLIIKSNKMISYLLRILLLLPFIYFNNIYAVSFPNVCDVINKGDYKNAINFNYSYSTCGWPFPRPCVHLSYYVPKYFIEVVGEPKETFFSSLPGVKAQLALTPPGGPSGVDDDNGSYSFNAHTIRVPFSNLAYSGMPCGGTMLDLFCFTSMSEHIGPTWKTGSADAWQPKWLAWSLSPKACLIKGAAESVYGSGGRGYGSDIGMCSFNAGLIPKFPPSARPVCTGWGVHFPRTGTVTSSDPTTASLVIASRIKSIGSEVFQSVASSYSEKWQMIYPQTSSCFREGQNVGILRVKRVSELGRLKGKFKNYLYAIWQKTSCTRDIPWVWYTKGWIAGMKLACKGF